MISFNKINNMPFFKKMKRREGERWGDYEALKTVTQLFPLFELNCCILLHVGLVLSAIWKLQTIWLLLLTAIRPILRHCRLPTICYVSSALVTFGTTLTKQNMSSLQGLKGKNCSRCLPRIDYEDYALEDDILRNIPSLWNNLHHKTEVPLL